MPNETQIVGICLYPRFSNHCLANALEPLRAANDLSGRPLYRWHLLTPEGGAVLSSSGLPVTAEARLGCAPGGDLLMLMPGYGHAALTRHGAELRRAAFRYGTVAGLDAGAWLMAQAGLLEGREATIHADLSRAFAERFPQVAVRPARWVEDGPRLTAGGAMAAFEMVLHLIRRRHGGALAQDVAALFLAGPGSGPSDRLVARALALMEAHVEAPLPIDEIAQRAGATPRRLARRFARAFGETPRSVYTGLRLEAGRRALEAGDCVTEAAARAGYADPSAFARAMRRRFGAAPSTFR